MAGYADTHLDVRSLMNASPFFCLSRSSRYSSRENKSIPPSPAADLMLFMMRSPSGFARLQNWDIVHLRRHVQNSNSMIRSVSGSHSRLAPGSPRADQRQSIGSAGLAARPVTMRNKMTWPTKAGSNSSILAKTGHSNASNDVDLDIGGSHPDVNRVSAHEYTSLRYAASDFLKEPQGAYLKEVHSCALARFTMVGCSRCRDHHRLRSRNDRSSKRLTFSTRPPWVT